MTSPESERRPVEDVFEAERPWGGFQQLVSNETVTVKILTVQPGHRLSLQRHESRGEMWQVLDVPLDIVVGDTVVYSKYGGTEIKVGGEDVIILRADDVLGILNS